MWRYLSQISWHNTHMPIWQSLRGSFSWVATYNPTKTQPVTLTNFVWHMCGRLVGGVGPKMKSCYLLRVKQGLAFCCPLLPNKLFFVFWEVRFLPGVFSFQTYRRFLWFVPFWVRGWVRSPTSTVPKPYELTRFKASWSRFPPANWCFLLHIWSSNSAENLQKHAGH